MFTRVVGYYQLIRESPRSIETTLTTRIHWVAYVHLETVGGQRRNLRGKMNVTISSRKARTHARTITYLMRWLLCCIYGLKRKHGTLRRPRFLLFPLQSKVFLAYSPLFSISFHSIASLTFLVGSGISVFRCIALSSLQL